MPGGLRTPGGLVLFDFQPSVGILADRIDRLGRDISHFREPLFESIKTVMIPSIRANFKAEGRPAWDPLSDYTVKRRKGDTGPILRRLGRLQRDATSTKIWLITDTAASIQTWPQSSWYGAVHQAGYGGQTKRPRKPTFKGVVSAAQIMAGGNVSNQSIPARPFIMYQEQDVVRIHEIFDRWLERQVDENWSRG